MKLPKTIEGVEFVLKQSQQIKEIGFKTTSQSTYKETRVVNKGESFTSIYIIGGI